MPSSHFTRVLKRSQINEMIDQLRKITPKEHLSAIANVKARQESFEIKAPDGDIVFAGLVHSNGTHYLCRLHKEIWDNGN